MKFQKNKKKEVKTIISVSKQKNNSKEKKEKTEPKKDISKCGNCTYQTLPSGIEILLKKCNDCKTKKKK